MNDESDEEKPLTEIEKQLARMLTRLRREHEWTLRELSGRTGLSESYLSRVENFRMPISIAKLGTLAAAFDVPVGRFFEGERQNDRWRFTPAGEGTRIRLRGGEGVDVRLLADTLDARVMEPFVVDVTTATRDAPMLAHEGEEFIYVIRGHCRLHVGVERFALSVGDAMYFDSGIPHRIEPVGGRPCELLAVVTSKHFTFQPSSMAR